ncbi:MAG: diphosphomevalonate decarboxylase [Candidatus Marsarchaeota archaeon]|nr:diphosphomevalonate decarboxylase [Candidatus Marsarchaeota archaeon]MCL5106219.1 diphosphomevalonate decarboxylase [Candidatus Marsarchaeota archaeon]
MDEKTMQDLLGKVFTAKGSSNIAFSKYWGKENEKLILPCNSSISMTLDNKDVHTITSVLFSDKIESDVFVLNGEIQDLENKDTKERFEIVNIMRKIADTSKKALVISENSFPTAAGLASSASGISTLVYACNDALKLGLSAKELSIIARQGSGSSCRSVVGGIAKWNKGGNESDGSDSYVEQIVDEKYWPELMDIIAIVDPGKKKVSSRAGMKQTVETSPLYKLRPKYVEENIIPQLTEAIKSRDFEAMGKLIMKESNDLHAVMLDTYPPIFYLNDISRDIIYAVHELNQSRGKIIGAYTFDAGPNAHIITTQENKDGIISLLKNIDGVKEVLSVKIGSGPVMLGNEEALITKENIPKFLKLTA